MWRELSKSMHSQLQTVHQTLFTSNLDDVHHLVRDRLINGPVLMHDSDEYMSQFNRKRSGAPNDTPLPPTIIDKLNTLANDNAVRFAPAWTVGIQFTEQGALVAPTFGIINNDISGLGPVESMGIGLERPAHPLPPDIMQQKLEQEYNPAIEAALQSGRHILFLAA